MKKIFSYTLILSLLILTIFIRPISIYMLEKSLSSLLETPVKVLSFNILSLDLHASIKDKKNTAHVKINSLYPLEADVNYEGNIDAFKVYQPLKASSTLRGKVYYKDHLDIQAKLFCMQAKTDVHVEEKTDTWSIDANISSLSLQSLKEENNISIELSGTVDILVDVHTSYDSIIKLSSQKIKVHEQGLDDVHLEIKDVKDHIQAYALFKASNIDYKGIWFNYYEDTNFFDGKLDLRLSKADNNIVISLKGEHNNSKVYAEVDALIAASHIGIKDIVYDLNTTDASANLDIRLKQMQRHTAILSEFGAELQGDLNAKAFVEYRDKKVFAQMQTQSLGGDLNVLYKNSELSWQASAVSIEKLLYILKMEKDIISLIDTNGSFKNDMVKARLQTNSFKIDKTEIQDIKIQALGKINDLNLKFQAKTPYASIKQASVHIKELKDLNLSAQILTPYTKEEISLNTQVSYENSRMKLVLQAKSKELHLDVFKTSYEDEVLKGNYKLFVFPGLSNLQTKLRIDGSFSYNKDFNIIAKSKNFGGKLRAELKANRIKIQAKKIEAETLLSELKLPPYLHGKANFYMQGDFDTQSFSFQSHRLGLDKKHTGLDENLSCFIKGNIDSKRVYIEPEIKNSYLQTSKGNLFFKFKEKELFLNLPIKITNAGQTLNIGLNTRLKIKEEIKGELNLSNKDNLLSLKDLRHKSGSFNTKLYVDIKELHPFAKILNQELYGPLKLNAKVRYTKNKPEIYMQTSSFGGGLRLLFNDKDLKIEITDLLARKLGYLLKEDQGTTREGKINGLIKYNVEHKKGRVNLSSKDVIVMGLDIDKSMQEVQDMLGLNIFSMGETIFKKRFSKTSDANLSTEIKQMKFDIEIRPEGIISNDIALSTNQNRFAVNAHFKPTGEIENFEIAIVDARGCAFITQKLEGNISNPSLVNTKATAVVVLGKAPQQILNTGGRVVKAGAGLIDSAASFIWKEGLRQDSTVTLVENTLTKGSNIFSSGTDMLVSGECKIFYNGAVNPPDK